MAKSRTLPEPIADPRAAEETLRQQKLAEAIQKQRAIARVIAARKSRDSLLDFTRFTMPHPENVDDVSLSLFETNWHHEAICQALEKSEKGLCPRLIITLPPRHGKSEICSRRFPAWFMGRDPYRQTIFATYGADFAEDFGRKAREVIQMPAYRQIFPGVTLKKTSKAADRMETEQGGMMVWTGVGGPATGRGADALLIDDPIKDREQAESMAHRNKVWDWFTAVAYTRLMPAGRIVIVLCMTGDTPVMLPDGSHRRLDALRVGDSVATYDNGRLSTSTVRNVRSNGLDSVYKITTSSGRVVRANGRHPFLVSDNGELKWVRTKNLSTASRIVSVPGSGENGSARPASPKDATSLRSAGAIACRTTTRKNGLTVLAPRLIIPSRSVREKSNISTGSRLKNTMVSLFLRGGSALSAVLENLPNIGAMGFALTIATKPARFAGYFAMPAILRSGALGPSMLRSRCSHISEFTTDRVVSVEPDGEEEVFDVQIDRTENFIANGLVSHNTRWHEDDIVGRIFNADYVPKEEADKWFVLNLPAILNEGQVDEALPADQRERALWPGRFPLEVLKSTRAFIGDRDFTSLYQQKPSPPEGVYFRAEMIKTYDLDEMPKNPRVYMAADLALTEDKRNDETCAGLWLVDENDTLFLSPDLFWQRKAADKCVEELIDMMDRGEPQSTYWEKGQIDRALGPFLKKRMVEREIYSWLNALPLNGNKGQRALAIRGRMAQGKVLFPRFAPWWPRAKDQLLKFTGSGDDAEDDFVDQCSIIGQALGKQLKANKTVEKKSNVIKVGSLAWIKKDSDYRKSQEKQMNRGGF